MDQLYVVVTNASSVVVGKNVYAGDAQTGLNNDISKWPSLTFTTVDETTFGNTAFVGPNYNSNN